VLIPLPINVKSSLNDEIQSILIMVSIIAKNSYSLIANYPEISIFDVCSSLESERAPKCDVRSKTWRAS
jgi:hypothetical protein